MEADATAFRQKVIKNFQRGIDMPAKRSRKRQRVFIVIAINRHLESKAIPVKRKFQKQAVFFPVLDIVTCTKEIAKAKCRTSVVHALHRRRPEIQQVIARIA